MPGDPTLEREDLYYAHRQDLTVGGIRLHIIHIICTLCLDICPLLFSPTLNESPGV